MAVETNGATVKRRRKTRSTATRRRTSTLSRARNAMQNAVGDDVAAMRAEVDQLIGDLEERIDRLNRLTKRGAEHAAGGANDFVMNAISGLTGSLAGRAESNAKSMSDEVAKMGNQALHRVVTEIDKRPLLTLAIVAGIGFIAGLARRAD